jgi:hypothetical protein
VSDSQLVLDRSNIIPDGYGKLRTPPDLKIARQLASCAIRETEVWASDASISFPQLGGFPEIAVEPTCRSIDRGARGLAVLCNSALADEWDWNS